MHGSRGLSAPEGREVEAPRLPVENIKDVMTTRCDLLPQRRPAVRPEEEKHYEEHSVHGQPGQWLLLAVLLFLTLMLMLNLRACHT